MNWKDLSQQLCHLAPIINFRVWSEIYRNDMKQWGVINLERESLSCIGYLCLDQSFAAYFSCEYYYLELLSNTSASIACDKTYCEFVSLRKKYLACLFWRRRKTAIRPWIWPKKILFICFQERTQNYLTYLPWDNHTKTNYALKASTFVCITLFHLIITEKLNKYCV